MKMIPRDTVKKIKGRHVPSAKRKQTNEDNKDIDSSHKQITRYVTRNRRQKGEDEKEDEGDEVEVAEEEEEEEESDDDAAADDEESFMLW